MNQGEIDNMGLRIALRAVELWLATSRCILSPHPDSKRMFEEGKQVIVALWHAGLIYTLYHFRKLPATIMVSGSRDGEWVARVLNIWGQQPVRGSRLKGGLVAIRDMTSLLKRHPIYAGIVADGSKGPPCIAQKGAVILARDTGLPIVPTGIGARPAYYFNSWDRLMLPMPFSRVVMVYGPPIHVPAKSKGGDIEAFRLLLERELNKATLRARKIAKTRGAT